MASSDDEYCLDEVDLFHASIKEKDSLRLYGSDRDTKDEDSESDVEEVMGLDTWTSEDEESKAYSLSDKAWGKRKSEFYAEESDTEREELQTELEEREAMGIQYRLTSAFSDKDFEPEWCDSDEDYEVEVSANLHKEKKLMVSSQHPELPQVIESLKQSLGDCLKHPVFSDCGISAELKLFLETSDHLNLCYCVNLLCYLLLKTIGVSPSSHPVTSTLVQLQKLKSKLEVVANLLKRKGPLKETVSPPVLMSKPHPMTDELLSATEDPLTFYHRVEVEKRRNKKRSDLSNILTDKNTTLAVTHGKRAITYQIARNKGISLTRRRELRNPRVKHKLKYKKALIKRKSQVLPVIKEMNKYGGETSGIRTNIARSTKISS